MSVRSYTVEGMTCDHCVKAITSEVTQLAGVDAVAVDLATGTVKVSGDQVDDAAVATAIDEAGYTVVS